MFPLATGGTAVAVLTVTIITLLFGWFDDKVAAVSEVLPLTEGGTVVTA